MSLAPQQMLASHRFVVVLHKGEYDFGSWSKVSGLSVKWNKISYRYGESNKDFVFAGNATYENLKLSRAACADSKTVKAWLKDTAHHRKTFDGSVTLRDHKNAEVITWDFHDLFPIGWSITEIDATSGKPMIETLELAHSGFIGAEGKVRS